MDALTRATLLSTEAPFARGFLASDAIPAQRAGSGRTATLEGLRTTAAVVLLVTGVLLLAEAVVTLAWQEPFSAWSAARQQDALSAELRKAESAALAAPAAFAAERGPVESTGPAAFAARHRRATDAGDPLGRLKIPKIGAQFVFVEGADPDQLEKGPGHYVGTALPGERGTVGVAGHRTTYLAPFRNIDALRKGDPILVQMPYGRFRYEVEGSIVVSPGNTRSLRPVKHDRLVLTTCTPLFSAAQRLVVTASLVSSTRRSGLSGARRGSRTPLRR